MLDPASLFGRLRVPVIAAPMTGVSGPALVAAACAAGVVGAFPTQNTETLEVLDAWLDAIERRLDGVDPEVRGPLAVNLVMRREPQRVHDEAQVLIRRGVRLVITSVGSPAPVIGPLHDAGVVVLADVATLHHAERALAAGADGLVLLASGAGGQTGWMNPLAFSRAVRGFFDGPLVMAGGIADGDALWASIVLGCDLGYVGTGLIATDESLASDAYKDAVVAASLDDVETFVQRSGISANFLRLGGAGPSPRDGEPPSPFSAGHTVSMVCRREPVGAVIERLCREYEQAKRRRRGRPLSRLTT